MISVKGSRELQAVVLALKVVDQNLRPEMYARTRQHILPDWTSSIQERINARDNSKLHTALLMKGTRVGVGTQGVNVTAAASTKAIRKGSTLSPAGNFYLAEFGANPKEVNVRGRRGGTQYEYQRKVNTGFLSRSRKGRFAYRAADEIISRSVALWVQTVVQVINEAVEKGAK